MEFLKRIIFISTGLLANVPLVWAQSDAPPPPRRVLVEPIQMDHPVRLKVPKGFWKPGTKLRIKNLATGRSTVLDAMDEEFLSSTAVRALTAGGTTELIPEFSALEMKKTTRWVPVPAKNGSFGDEAFSFSHSLVFTQPTWRHLGFRALRTESGETDVELDTQGQNVVPTVEEAAHRRSLIEDRGIRRLFEIGWKAIATRRFDISLEAFDRILVRKEYLTDDQSAQAFLGRAISRFHQKGCKDSESDFAQADRDRRNVDDVSYYRGLCFVEVKRLADADTLFQELVRKQSAKYAEPSRFYLGVVAENQERYDAAESAYLDTVDFASDASLVALAKSRLKLMREERANREYAEKWFTFGATGGVGYDSNVVALPQQLSPADYNLLTAASPSVMGLALVDFKLPWSRKLENHIRYSFMALHYANAAISTGNDVQVHDASATFDFALNARNRMGFGGDYNALFLGPIGQDGEYITTPSGDVHLLHLVESEGKAVGQWMGTLRYARIMPQTAPVSADQDLTANSYVMDFRYSVTKFPPHIFGPGLTVEYHPAAGQENSYYSATLLGQWSFPIGPQKWNLAVTQEGDAQYSSYYQSAAGRVDYVLRYTGSLSKAWSRHFETRLQFTGNLNYSTEPASYQYDKATLTLFATALF